MNRLLALLLSLLWLCLVIPMNSNAQVPANRGVQFIPFQSLSGFKKSMGTNGEVIFTSKEINPRLEWNELIASWNADMPTDGFLRIEVRALFTDRPSKWYVMGLWSGNPEKIPRESVRRQRDADGDVDTDTLILKKSAERVQVRVVLGAKGKRLPKVKFLSLSLQNRDVKLDALSPNRNAWGKTLEVPERSQMAYENGGVLCSPTTVSMLLSYWSKELKKPGLDHDVPEVVTGVFDPEWRGTGNWVFNTAYAGAQPGMRAYTARLTDVSELEDFVAHGIPVGLSLCYNRLRGKSREPSGHLVVCVGFTETGDAIINDPGTRQNVRKTYPRANLIDAWAYSKNAVYLIYPEKAKLPEDRFGHWDSRATRRLAK